MDSIHHKLCQRSLSCKSHLLTFSKIPCLMFSDQGGIVLNIYNALSESCKRAGTPLRSEPSYGWTFTESAVPVSTVTGADGSVTTVS